MLKPTQTDASLVMKCDPVKLSQHKGSSGVGETGPLFPPIHVKEAAKAAVRGPPRNKMALFEQFTIPYSAYVPSNKLATAAECVSRQEDKRGFLNSNTKYTRPSNLAPAGVSKKDVGRIGKTSLDSSLGSFSTCSAVVNVDVSQSFQVAEVDENTASLSPSKPQIFPANVDDKLLTCLQSKKMTEGTCLAPHAVKAEACQQGIGARFEGSRMFDQVPGVVDNVKAEVQSVTDQSIEATEDTKCSPAAGDGQLIVAKVDDISSKDSAKDVQVLSLPKPEIAAQVSEGGCLNPLQNTVVSNQCEALIFSGGKVRSVLSIIKPKDVIQTVGQQVFWKARKAILRQQEIFSNQVFELHKLIEVQKLLAKMPSTFLEEHLVSRTASDMVGGDFYTVKVNAKKLENISEGAQVQAPVSNRHKCEGLGSRHKPRCQAIEEGGTQVVGASHKRQASSCNLPQAMTNAPYGQTTHPSSCDGVSAWGYPLTSLNRPLFYPPGAGRFPSGTGFGVAYTVNTSPPMAPFSFPCYNQRPEQPTPVFCPSNQWSNLMYHHPFLVPMANEWFTMNHRNQIPVPSGSERLGPTNSVPSINMRAEASSQSVQPAAVPLSCRQQVEKIVHKNLEATKSYGSIATAGLSIAREASLGKPDLSNMDEHNATSKLKSRFIPTKVKGAFSKEQNSAAAESRGLSIDMHEAQVALFSRLDRMADSSVEKNILTLFPLQPASSSEGQVQRHAEGSHARVIKAIPHSALAASESAAGILLSIQRERQM